jgi:hypothetical protein
LIFFIAKIKDFYFELLHIIKVKILYFISKLILQTSLFFNFEWMEVKFDFLFRFIVFFVNRSLDFIKLFIKLGWRLMGQTHQGGPPPGHVTIERVSQIGQ